MTLKRIQREIIDLQKEDKGDIQLSPVEDNLHIWKGSIPGPEGSVYEGGVFDVDIVLPNDYPLVPLSGGLYARFSHSIRFSAPRAMFKTKYVPFALFLSSVLILAVLQDLSYERAAFTFNSPTRLS